MHCKTIFVLYRNNVINWKSSTFFMIFGLLACQSPLEEKAFTIDTKTSQTYPLLVNEQTVWESREIPVCWMEDDPGFQSSWLRKIVRQGANAWESVSQIRFTGWLACKGNERGIQIKLGDSMRWSGIGWSYIGTLSRSQKPSLFLSINQIDEHQLRVLAMHHFGHALGFEHEQKRQDTPDDCILQDARHDDGSYATVGPYDQFSVMNYCNPYWSNSAHLSAIDIFGAQNFYGIP